MKILQFVATGDKHNSYRALFNGKDIDGCDINSKDMVTQAHVIVANLMNTLQKRFKAEENHLFDITFDDTKAIHQRTKYAASNIFEMAAYLPQEILKVYNIEP